MMPSSDSNRISVVGAQPGAGSIVSFVSGDIGTDLIDEPRRPIGQQLFEVCAFFV